MNWAIFCRVVDNYGDIGVCWRLARQLQHEYGFAIHLWVDDLTRFSHFCNSVKDNLSEQIIDEVRVIHWSDDEIDLANFDVVIAAFGCELSLSNLRQMTIMKRPPLWINLEYLSAESWVERYHGVASVNPRFALRQYYFYPGFTPATGGLLRERCLLNRREQFDTLEQNSLWCRLNLSKRATHELRISLFFYNEAPFVQLLRCWIALDQPITCILVGGRSLPEGFSEQIGNLKIISLPFLSQCEYDQLLWACDINFVRGEDSFVRAQWAQHPLVWQIYPQPALVHKIKLEAFLEGYFQGDQGREGQVQSAFWYFWNQLIKVDEQAVIDLWCDFRQALAALDQKAQNWAKELAKQKDLTRQLVEFCQLRLE